MKRLFQNLISSTHGNGPSSTRLIYLINGLAAAFSALVITIGGMVVYCATKQADTVYWAGVAALWTATLGFGAKAKNEQQKASKEIALAPRRALVPATASGD
jgi:uncharacterized membrane protein YuzA (DUF378 family)